MMGRRPLALMLLLLTVAAGNELQLLHCIILPTADPNERRRAASTLSP